MYVEEANRRMQMFIGERLVTPGEMFPSQYVPTLSMTRKGEIHAYPMYWGFRLRNGKLCINARSENLPDGNSQFKSLWLQRRCVIPCDFYYEWQKEGVEKPVKYEIRSKGSGIVYLAGIYRYEDNPKLPSCAILTTSPSGDIGFIHNRMPVIFSEENCRMWLTGEMNELDFPQCVERDMRYAVAG